MSQPSPDACSVPESATAPQDVVVITAARDGVLYFPLATERRDLPATLEEDAGVGVLQLDCSDADARLAIEAAFVNAVWFTLADMLAFVARVPSTRGTRRDGRRRQERGQ
jgi:hypothetical protein